MTDVSVRAEGAEKEAIRTNFPYFYLIIVNTQNFPPRLATAETELYATKKSYEICSERDEDFAEKLIFGSVWSCS